MGTERDIMTISSMTEAGSSSEIDSDERREWLRIDDNLLLEYRLADEASTRAHAAYARVTPDMIAAAVEKPTAELFSRSGDVLADSVLVPWMRKVDWLLEVILNTLAKTYPSSMDLARITTVNISAGGIGFVSPQLFEAGDRLSLKVILPPFIPIDAMAKVIRSEPDPKGQGYALATEFVDLGEDDQEHLIRYILQTQAERLRASRRSDP